MAEGDNYGVRIRSVATHPSGYPFQTRFDMCNIEFPHFGASYPDAHCIDGYLYDMDSYEDGAYTIGGDDPCPFCNTEEWLKDVLDDEIFKTREEALEWVEKMRKKWGA